MTKMPRPRRATAEAFYDVFADFSIEDQAAALKILEQVHRLRIRETTKRQPAPATVASDTKLFADGEEVKSLSDLERAVDIAGGLRSALGKDRV
jgi:hypothetical protein